MRTWSGRAYRRLPTETRSALVSGLHTENFSRAYRRVRVRGCAERECPMRCFLLILVLVSELCCSSRLPSAVACFQSSAVMAPRRSQQSRRRVASPSAMSDPCSAATVPKRSQQSRRRDASPSAMSDPCSTVMEPKRSQQSRRRDASPWAMSDPELEVDASWVDIDELPASPDHFYKYSPPKCFYDQMVKDRDFWARDVSTLVDGDRIVRTIARAIQVTCVPWHTDWTQWRRHAADFFRRLCAHRASSQRKSYILQQRIAVLESKIEALQCNERVTHKKISALEDVIGRLYTAGDLESPRGRGQDQAAVDSDTVQDRITRAQLRAISSRSPEPRRELARLSRELERDGPCLP